MRTYKKKKAKRSLKLSLLPVTLGFYGMRSMKKLLGAIIIFSLGYMASYFLPMRSITEQLEMPDLYQDQSVPKPRDDAFDIDNDDYDDFDIDHADFNVNPNIKETEDKVNEEIKPKNEGKKSCRCLFPSTSIIVYTKRMLETFEVLDVEVIYNNSLTELIIS